MTVFVALLRAVNVGGTGKLPMTALKSLCEDAGFTDVRTYIASGNVVLRSRLAEAGVKGQIEKRLMAYSGKPIGVIVRTRAEMAAVLDANPFPGRPGNRTVVLFLDETPAVDAIGNATHRRSEEVVTGTREIYLFHPDGIGESKLVLPDMKKGTARNLNTVAKLVEMAAAMP